MAKLKKPIPKFESEEQAAEYWDTHSPLEHFYEEDWKPLRAKRPKQPKELTEEQVIEVEVNKVIIHRWEMRVNKGAVRDCDYWDCAHKIQPGEEYCNELYPGGHILSYCLKCSAFFMAQALNALLTERQEVKDKAEEARREIRELLYCQHTRKAIHYSIPLCPKCSDALKQALKPSEDKEGGKG